MMSRSLGGMLTLAAVTMVAGCNASYDVDGREDAEDFERAGKVEQAAGACVGDDVKYDFNAFAASLAVAIANEMKRWDVSSDFEVRNGKLELSATGNLRCGGNCPNVSALLRLQDDAASSVPNHSPAIYRAKLTDWYNRQRTKLVELVNKMLYVDKGIYRMRVRHSGKYMAVDNGYPHDGALIEQRGSVSQAGADQWRLVLEGTTHRFINVRSGKCLALGNDSDNAAPLIQETCAAKATQKFDFTGIGNNWYGIRTKYGKALDVRSVSMDDDAAIIQYQFGGNVSNQAWEFEWYGSGKHIEPIAPATAVYSLTARHSNKAVGVSGGSLADYAPLEQATYNESDDRFHWYLIRNQSNFQLVNRRSGKCMAMDSFNNTSRFSQQPCNQAVGGQTFWFEPTGDGTHLMWTPLGTMLQVEGASTADGARINQSSGGWDLNRQFTLKPILAGEPHRLTFAYKTNDAACGEHNYWYNIVKPNGLPLDFPQDTWVQLMFAGGKQSQTGCDLNPFIAQKVSGNLVAIDPTGGLNEGSFESSGSCTAACTQYSSTSVIGSCCSCNGVNKKFIRSSFSSAIYLCTG